MPTVYAYKTFHLASWRNCGSYSFTNSLRRVVLPPAPYITHKAARSEGNIRLLSVTFCSVVFTNQPRVSTMLPPRLTCRRCQNIRILSTLNSRTPSHTSPRDVRHVQRTETDLLKKNEWKRIKSSFFDKNKLFYCLFCQHHSWVNC